MAKKKSLYPGIAEAEKEKCKAWQRMNDTAPDFIGNAPNYDKYSKWDCEKVLVWLNID